MSGGQTTFPKVEGKQKGDEKPRFFEQIRGGTYLGRHFALCIAP